jgi:PST family polysaccharide transporter
MRKGTGVRSMIRFGAHLTGGSFFNYFAGNADNILIGKFIGAEALGLYARAYNMLTRLVSQIREPVNKVAIPVLCSLKDQPERYVKYYQRLIDVIASLSIPLMLYCAVEADFLVRILLGQRWLDVIPVFRMLAIGGLIHPVASTRGLVPLTHGFGSRFFYLEVFYAILVVASYIIGLSFGILGVAAGYTVSRYVILIPSLFYCFHKTPVTVSLFLRTVGVPTAFGLLAAGSIMLLKRGQTSDGFMSHLLCAGVFAAVYCGLSFCRESVRETSALLVRSFWMPSERKVGAA